ncbi:AfuB [Pasteurella multocida subsp. multocida str. Anand1_cattle]|nr:AfuB [Pasteurella multocida subsp. multocida str. Anand1_cattle]
MAAVIQKSPFNVANAILALSIGILVIVVAVPVLLIFINSFWVNGQFNVTDVVNILKQKETYEALLNSLFIAVGVTIMSTIVGTIFCLVSDTYRFAL